MADPEATAVLCYAAMHAFDCGLRGHGGPDDARLIRAAQRLVRRAAGLTTDSISTASNIDITVGATAGGAADASSPAAPDAPA